MLNCQPKFASRFFWRPTLPQPAQFTLARWSDIPVEPMNSLIGRQFVVGANTMLARFHLAKGAYVPLHSHANEQISHILSGRLKFVLEGQEVVVSGGEILLIPPNV